MEATFYAIVNYYYCVDWCSSAYLTRLETDQLFSSKAKAEEEKERLLNLYPDDYTEGLGLKVVGFESEAEMLEWLETL